LESPIVGLKSSIAGLGAAVRFDSVGEAVDWVNSVREEAGGFETKGIRDKYDVPDYVIDKTE
jgi:hypothetical protein